jgi:hypothetical protein
MFTAGLQDECIIKWQLTEEGVWWNLDNLDYDPDIVKYYFIKIDPVAEFIEKS